MLGLSRTKDTVIVIAYCAMWTASSKRGPVVSNWKLFQLSTHFVYLLCVRCNAMNCWEKPPARTVMNQLLSVWCLLAWSHHLPFRSTQQDKPLIIIF